MNETTYNFAMFGKEYLDKAIDGIQTLAPKVYWYLQWKCWIDAIQIIVLILITIIGYVIWNYYFKKTAKIIKEDSYDGWNDDKYIGKTVLLVLTCLMLIGCIITILINLPTLIQAFTPICPIDKAIALGQSIIK